MENRSIAFVGLGRMGAPMAARLAAQRRLGVAADHTEVYRYLAALKRRKKAKRGGADG